MKKESDYFSFRRRKLPKPGLTMKLFILFSLVCVFNTQAIDMKAQQAEIQLNLKNTPLTEVLKKIQQQSGYNILYSNELIKNAKPVNVTIQSKDIREVMNTCLSGNALAYEIENGTILIRIAPPCVLIIFSELFSYNIHCVRSDQQFLICRNNHYFYF